MNDDFPSEEELRDKLLGGEGIPLIMKRGNREDTLLSIMPDPYSGGWFAVVWQYPPDDEPIGTIRSFNTMREATEWLMVADEPV